MGEHTVQLSVVIPFRDAGATLTEAALAVTRQMQGHSVELVLADNGSRDESKSTARELAATSSSVRVVHATNAVGAAGARNAGAATAVGKVLAFTDADDIVLPGWVDAILGLGEAEDLFASGPVLRFAEGADVPRVQARPSDPKPMRHMRHLPYADGTNTVVAASLFRRAGGFDHQCTAGEDIDFSWRVQRLGAHLQFVPELRVAARWKSGMWATLRQYFRYGYGDALLYRRYRRDGARRDALLTLARAYGGIVLRLPLLFGHRQRNRWAHQAGRRAGRLAGSVRYRVLYP